MSTPDSGDRTTGARVARTRAAIARRLLVLLALLVALPARAQLPTAPADSAAPVVDPAGAPDSPRAALRQFLAAANEGDYARAARFLVLDRRNAARGPELARRLHQFIERRVILALDSVSPLPQGDPSDGEPPLHDRVGRVQLPDGTVARPIVMQKVTAGGESRWVIDTETVEAVDRQYAALEDSWLARRLPPALREAGPFGFPHWKWILLIVGGPLVWVLTLLAGFVLRRLALLVTRRTSVTWDNELVVRLRGPMRLFLASVLAWPLLLALDLDASTLATLAMLLRGIAVVAIFWAVLRVIAVAEDHLAQRVWAGDRTTARTVIPLIGRTLRVALGLVALLIAISQFGYPVGTILAGLGLGGIVVALAAQKTVENLFGSVSLAADRAFRVGDFVKVGDVSGTVEAIGLRSTSVRTLERTVVKIPNGRLADMQIESFGPRDRIRFAATLRLARDTRSEVLRAVLRDVEQLVRLHPQVHPDVVSVRLSAIGDWSVDLSVYFWFATADFGEFELLRQEMLLGILETIERAGARLALPMQVTRVEGTDGVTAEAARLRESGTP